MWPRGAKSPVQAALSNIRRRDGRVSLGGHFCPHERYSPDEGGFVRCGRAVQNRLYRLRFQISTGAMGAFRLEGIFCPLERYSPDDGGFVRCGRAVQNRLHRMRISNIYPQARWMRFAWRAFFARWRDTALMTAALSDVAARCKIACTGRAFKYPQARWARILRRKIREKRLFSRSAVFKVRKSEIFCK